MKIMKTGIVCLCIVFQFSCASMNSSEKNNTQAQQPAPTSTPQTTTSISVEEIKPILIDSIKRKDLLDGCGCYFMLESDKEKNNQSYVFFGSVLPGEALMNIEGKDVYVKQFHSGDRAGLKKGDKYKETYKTGNILIQMDYTVTAVCDPGDEACESTGLDVTITAQQGKRRGTVNATGWCGC